MERWKHSVLAGIVFLSVMAFSLPVSAATHTVRAAGGADFTTIQAAMTASSAGDVIFVYPGTYMGPITLTDGVILQGFSPESTIIDGGGAAYQVVIYSGSLPTTIAGFTIRGSSFPSEANTWDSGGVWVGSGPLVIRNNVIIGNESGIAVGQSGTPLILNNTILNNDDAGIILGSPPTTQTIKNNIIVNNTIGIFYYGNPSSGDISYNDVMNISKNYHDNSVGPPEFTPLPGTGEISADPMFVDAAGGDYHLAEGSPCIDAGDPAAAYNDVDGTRNDMGAYGGPGGGGGGIGAPGSGFFFTSIGKIPSFQITQASGSTSLGLANVLPVVASDLRIPQYKDAPFARNLWIFGMFGDLDPVNYYQILIAPYGTTDFVPLTDPLVKYRYELGPGGVTVHREVLGPLTVYGVNNVYKLTRTGVWTPPPDLRLILNSREWPDGQYRLICRAFADRQGYLEELDLQDTGYDDIVIWIDNSPVDATIHMVKYDPSNPHYNPATDGEIPECGKINLGSSTENLRFVITAWHPNGFLREYSLTASYGRNRSGGTIRADQYAGSNDGSPPVWNGVSHTEFDSSDSAALNPWQTCPYSFHLHAWSRATDGYTYNLIHDSFVDHYYLDLVASMASLFDLDFSSAGFSPVSKYRIHLGNVPIEIPPGAPAGLFWLEFDFNKDTLSFDLADGGPEGP